MMCITSLIKIVNLRFAALTNYGWGYFTGYTIFLILFSALLYFSGKKIIREINQT